MSAKQKFPASFERLLAQYDYAYPESAVALAPAEPRDAARLLVDDRRRKLVAYSTFAHLTEFLPPQSVLVLNETKVIPARLEVIKPTGGKVRILFVADEGRGGFRALADRPLESGMTLDLGGRRPRLQVISREKDGYRFEIRGARLRPIALFERYGRTPIPPYLKGTPLGEKALREKYQTVFARQLGSVAAPTASLHFTKRLLARLKTAGHDLAYVTLHVNLGTFAPLTPQAVAEGQLHEEHYEISAKAVALLTRAKREGRPIIAVGTTALRALEAAADARGRLRWPVCETRLFIRPGYRFTFVDGLITNFHVPKSSLLMLVAAFIGRHRLLRLYQSALKRGFRIFSFGDGMLLLPGRAMKKRLRT